MQLNFNFHGACSFPRQTRQKNNVFAQQKNPTPAPDAYNTDNLSKTHIQPPNYKIPTQSRQVYWTAHENWAREIPAPNQYTLPQPRSKSIQFTKKTRQESSEALGFEASPASYFITTNQLSNFPTAAHFSFGQRDDQLFPKQESRNCPLYSQEQEQQQQQKEGKGCTFSKAERPKSSTMQTMQTPGPGKYDVLYKNRLQLIHPTFARTKKLPSPRTANPSPNPTDLSPEPGGYIGTKDPELSPDLNENGPGQYPLPSMLSQTQYSFPKAKLQSFVERSTVPGPGSYQTQIKQASSPKSKGRRRTQPTIRRKKQQPGNNNNNNNTLYDVRQDMAKTTQGGIFFPRAKRDPFAASNAHPGVGDYQIENNERLKRQTFYKQNKKSWFEVQKVPGPANYQVRYKGIEKNSIGHSIGQQQRFRRPNNNPGPGQYDHYSSFGLPKYLQTKKKLSQQQQQQQQEEKKGYQQAQVRPIVRTTQVDSKKRKLILKENLREQALEDFLQNKGIQLQ